MSNTINSAIAGILTQDKTIEEWWVSQPIAVPYFANAALQIVYEKNEATDNSLLQDADAAITNFLHLRAEDKWAITDLVYKNCFDFLNETGYDEADEPLRQIKNKNEIWNFVYPNKIYVKRRHRRDKDIYVTIDCECAWEQEHGLSLVYRQGKQLARISAFDGHLTEADAYDKPDSEDELLSKFIA
jgi:hypothetical protein